MYTKLVNLQYVNREQFQNDLITWFEHEKRDLPWRQDRDPYKIWVSEIMLQQTRVDTVIPYFNRFMEKFPTIESLANASEEAVLKAWEGLGYYSRVRNLHSAVKEVNEKYGGVVPKDKEQLGKLKGIGPYTLGAILSIAFGVPEPAVDGNVMRVLSRILLIDEDISKVKTRKIFEEAVRHLISYDNPSYFNQALMELGALICTPTSPKCLLCPVREHCSAFSEGMVEKLPVKNKVQKQRLVYLAAVILKTFDGKMVIHKRDDEGLLAQLWEFPNVELRKSIFSNKEEIERTFQNELGLKIELGTPLQKIEHVFSHLKWVIQVYEGNLRSNVKETERWKLVTTEQLDEFAFPVSHQKIIELNKMDGK